MLPRSSTTFARALLLLLLQLVLGQLTGTAVDAAAAATSSAKSSARRPSTRRSPAEKQTMLLIRMQQAFEMTHHLAAACNRHLHELRNRNERDFLRTVRDIGIAQDYGQIEAAFGRLVGDFCDAVDRKVGEQQRSSHTMVVAFERQVHKALPYSAESAENEATVSAIHELWQRNNDKVTQTLVTNRAEVVAATRATIERGWALYRESQQPCAAAAEPVNWQKRLERQTAELVVRLHKVTEKNRLAGLEVLKLFEAQYSDRVKHLLTIERRMHSEWLAKQAKD